MRRTLKRDLTAAGLTVQKTFISHSVTNLIPSTFLDTSTPSRSRVRLFTVLATLQERMPPSLPGCSWVMIGEKSR
jgi:hypothetical protein